MRASAPDEGLSAPISGLACDGREAGERSDLALIEIAKFRGLCEKRRRRNVGDAGNAEKDRLFPGECRIGRNQNGDGFADGCEVGLDPGQAVGILPAQEGKAQALGAVRRTQSGAGLLIALHPPHRDLQQSPDPVRCG